MFVAGLLQLPHEAADGNMDAANGKNVKKLILFFKNLRNLRFVTLSFSFVAQQNGEISIQFVKNLHLQDEDVMP